MILADLVAADTVFVDANIFTFNFQPHATWGPPCRLFLDRIDNGEIAGFTSTHILSELAHRMMTIEASALFGWSFANIGNQLRAHPARVQKLTAFRQAIDTVPAKQSPRPHHRSGLGRYRSGPESVHWASFQRRPDPGCHERQRNLETRQQRPRLR